MEDPCHTAEEIVQPYSGQIQREFGIAALPLNTGLALLLQAHRYANDVSRDPWDFAVEISNLRHAGLNESDFRWLICKGFVEHASDVTLLGQKGRTFCPNGELIFTRTTCISLTAAGTEFAENLLSRTLLFADPEDCRSGTNVSDDSQNGVVALPIWDSSRHELWLGNHLIKQFKHRSPNQEIILAAFQEEGWPVSVRDPLRPLQEVDSKRRLNDTIKSLNHHQVKEMMRFRGDGTGEGIIWERVVRIGRENLYSH
jgi:hypothetical protein